ARAFIITLEGRDALLQQFYAIEWAIIPNLAFDLIAPPLARLTGIYAAGKLFVLGYLALLATGPFAIHYALFRRHSLGPLVAMLFLYNRIALTGLLNFLFGLGLALWGAAAWIRLRQSPALLRGLVSLAFVIALFFCHMAALGIYGVVLLSVEAWTALS